ncbi:hypothetical protein SLS62_011345, partial [Diatrype stigma]
MITLLAILAAIQALGVTPGLAATPLAPSHEAAWQNGFQIFNSIHSAMRQWGSSLNHNGMAFIPVTIPRGSLFYHGTHRNRTAGPPSGPEWLAFEIEHSEGFAFSQRFNDTDLDGEHVLDVPTYPGPGSQVVLGRSPDEGIHHISSEKAIRGYLHTYRANRDLKLLYVDGSSAGKSTMGTLDTQDMVLRSLNDSCDGKPAWDERDRAEDLCNLVSAWGYDGIVRMEIGFEIIYCNFSSGLDLLSMLRRPFFGQPGGGAEPARFIFQFARAITQRYDGFDSNRVKLDFSRMVSAYFYPVNLTNPNPEARELPRLSSTTSTERKAIRSRVIENSPQDASPSIEWQSIVDMIVSRYRDRLAMMISPSVNPDRFIQEIFEVTNTHVEYPETPEDINSESHAVGDNDDLQRCITHYLQPTYPFQDSFTQEDKLIHTAIMAVTTRVCEALFNARKLIRDAYLHFYQNPEHAEHLGSTGFIPEVAQRSQKLIIELANDLQWTDWNKCRG